MEALAIALLGKRVMARLAQTLQGAFKKCRRVTLMSREMVCDRCRGDDAARRAQSTAGLGNQLKPAPFPPAAAAVTCMTVDADGWQWLAFWFRFLGSAGSIRIISLGEADRRDDSIECRGARKPRNPVTGPSSRLPARRGRDLPFAAAIDELNPIEPVRPMR
jgi:hypothetical protein